MAHGKTIRLKTLPAFIALVFLLVYPVAHAELSPLIPRELVFGSPTNCKRTAQLSPDGRCLSYECGHTQKRSGVRSESGGRMKARDGCGLAPLARPCRPHPSRGTQAGRSLSSVDGRSLSNHLLFGLGGGVTGAKVAA